MASKTIKPELPGGFRDYLPEEAVIRKEMLEIIEKTFIRFGFVPLDTPGVERREVLTGGDPDFDKQIFRVGLEKNKEDLALRFDLTVPLARVVAAYPQNISKPFKVYQIGRVWRGERQQAGRYREFLQCDVDIVGSSRIEADAEIVAVLYETVKALGVTDFVIKVNNRKIMNGLMTYIGLDTAQTPAVFRAIDKLDKQTWDTVAGELQEAGLNINQMSQLKTFFELRDAKKEKLLDGMQDTLQDSSEACEGVEELRKLALSLQAFGVPDNGWCIDPVVVRGLGYYTGPVFEISLRGSEDIGSVGGGGRYDSLVERFSSAPVPATGASIGFDRLFEGMKSLGLTKLKNKTQVIVLNFDDAARDSCLKVTTELRRAGISTELYLGQEDNLKGQLAYAAKRDVPVVVIIGPEEQVKNTAQLKDMKKRKQFEVPVTNVVRKIEELLIC